MTKGRGVPLSLCLFMLFGLVAINSVGAEEIFFSAHGSQSGKFPGEITQAGFEGTMKAIKYESELTTQQSTASARAGTRTHGPVKLTKKLGAASLAFFNAFKTGELLSITIDFFSPSRAGKSIGTHKMILTNARVTAIRQYSEPLGQTLGPMVVFEELTIAFQDIQLNDLLGGTSSQTKPSQRSRR